LEPGKSTLNIIQTERKKQVNPMSKYDKVKVIFGGEARKSLISGIGKFSRVVASTFGPLVSRSD
jgi:hypothetical protein